MKKQQAKQKQNDIIMLVVVFSVLILLNFVGSFLFKRFDLTAEKRYTLSESTKKLIKNLDDVLYLKIYLQGDFNPSFTRLKNETKELLDEYVSYSDGNIVYEFINPLDNPSKEETEKLEKQIYTKGIMPEQIVDKSSQKTSETLIWPGAIVSYKGKETVWQIYQRSIGIDQENNINNSVQYLSQTIDDFRNFFKPNKTKTNFIISDVIENTIKLMGSQFKNNNIYFVFSLFLNSFFISFFISAPHFPAPQEPAANADVAASKTPNNNPDNFIFIVILIPLNLIYLVV